MTNQREVDPREVDPRDEHKVDPTEGRGLNLTRRQNKMLEGTDRGTIGTWVLTVFLAIIFVMAGVPKLGGVGLVIQRFDYWGYPTWFQLLIGAVEFVFGILLIIPRFAFWAASGLSLIMVGAVYTHIARGIPALAIVPVVFMGLLMLLAWIRREDALGLGHPKPWPDELEPTA